MDAVKYRDHESVPIRQLITHSDHDDNGHEKLSYTFDYPKPASKATTRTAS